jgi:hypothetical protein
MFFLLFLLDERRMKEGSGAGSGSGSIPLTNRSGWPKHMWIRWIGFGSGTLEKTFRHCMADGDADPNSFDRLRTFCSQ